MRQQDAVQLFKQTCAQVSAGPPTFCCILMDVATAMYDAEKAEYGRRSRGFGIPNVWSDGEAGPGKRADAPRLRTQGGVLMASFCPFCGHEFKKTEQTPTAPVEPPVEPSAT
jgi:hypothetical protein